MSFDINSPNPVSYFEVPFDQHTTGAVTLSLNGRMTSGPEITDGFGESKVSCAVHRSRRRSKWESYS